MYISRIKIKNWRNFRNIDVSLHERMFIVGPNACGKSNFLDIFRFLRDVAEQGLGKSVEDRGGVSKIRCLSARQETDIDIEVELAETSTNRPTWTYALGIRQETSGHRYIKIVREKVMHFDELIIDRPNKDDKADELRLTQTSLEQINANHKFRDISKYFQDITYLHLIPQLLRYPKSFTAPGMTGDPYGRAFLEKIAKTNKNTRQSWLRKIEEVLKIAVPQLNHLNYVIDETGLPHLEAVYEHWRPKAGKQREDQFSDGTIRLIGLVWALLENKDSLLLLEEPELSLNSAIVRHIPSITYKLQKDRKSQIILSTHSADLLSDESIGAEEVLLMTPDAEGTKVVVASSLEEVKLMLDQGLTIADSVLPKTTPKNISQLSLF